MRQLSGNNELVPMTRRYPDLPNKVLKRDSVIVQKIMDVWESGEPKDVFKLFLKESDNLSPERYWELLRSMWILAGGLDTIETFRKLFSSTKRSRYYFSTPEESAKLRAMPDRFTVYRACSSENDGGVSWTISKEYVEHYASLFPGRKIIEKEIVKSQVFAYIERNKEHEIILL